VISVDLALPSATEALGAAVGGHLEPGDVILLTGELGAGKTTFTRGLVRRLGGGDEVTSPTFTLCHEYDTTPPVAHVDCWRLDEISEIVDLGLDELLDNGSCVVAEWGERAVSVIGSDAIVVAFEYHDDRRRATIDATGTRSRACLDALAAELGIEP
jgi:tRNA threonylcarbamoyl adenosine modification protein YjeE